MKAIWLNTSFSPRQAKEVAEREGVPAYLIDDEGEIEPSWLEGKETVLVTAGASAVTFFYSDTVAGQVTITGTPQVAGIAGFSIPVLIVPAAG